MSDSLQALPKVELHLHLDCSISYEVACRLDPRMTRDRFEERLVAPPKCRDLSDYLQRATNGVRLLQTTESLRLVTLDLFEQLREDNVIYAEIRFAPLLHTLRGLTPAEVLLTVLGAVEEGKANTGIEAGVIVCTLRNYIEQESLETVRIAKVFREQGVCGFDIAGDEVHFPLDPHVPAFAYARTHTIGATAHAGEALGPESVAETLDRLKVDRLGHGVRSVEDPRVLERLVTEKIHLEVCPTSNVQTNVFATLADHSLPRLWEAGVSLSINTDGRTTANVSLTDEYRKIRETFAWTDADFLQANRYALDAAFLPEAKKDALRRQLEGI